jgi:hypothetical protein
LTCASTHSSQATTHCACTSTGEHLSNRHATGTAAEALQRRYCDLL